MLTEKGYSFGRALREVAGEARAQRRARVRQHFINTFPSVAGDIALTTIITQHQRDIFNDGQLLGLPR